MRAAAVVACLMGLAFFAVGCAGPDNVKACEDFYDSLSCGSFDATTYKSTCSSYDNTSCDLAPYFDCLRDNFKCENDVADTSGWASCASKATCN